MCVCVRARVCVCVCEILQNNCSTGLIEFFYNTHKVANVAIFVLLKFENKLDTVVSHISFNSKHLDKIYICIKIYSADNYYQFISIRSCSKISTLCITWKFFWNGTSNEGGPELLNTKN